MRSIPFSSPVCARWRTVFAALIAIVLILACASTARARGADPASLAISVVDPLGAPVAGAVVTLTRDGRSVTDTTTDARGQSSLAVADAGRYGLDVTAPGIAARHLDAFYVEAGARVPVVVTLSIGLQQEVVVTAAAEALPLSRTAAAVTVIDGDTIAALAKPDVSEALRLVPGVNIAQTGARGSATSLFVRGGESRFSKVLVDGVPANDIGGVFDFADLDTAGVGRIEVMRNANSVLYGDDALTGVVSIETQRGHTRTPLGTYSFDAGNFGTSRHSLSLGGASDRVDYFAAFSRFDTDNDVANSAYRRNSFAGRIGVAVNASTNVTAVLHAGSSRTGLPNATDYYGESDDSTKREDAQMFSLSADSRISPRVKTTVSYALLHDDYRTDNPAPTGDYYDPFGYGGNYLGKPVTITGANGDAVTGQAILDYGGTYPSPYNALTTRHVVAGRATYLAARALDISAGVRVEHEAGSTDTGTPQSVSHNNSGAFVEAQARPGIVSVTAGLGFDDNAVYGAAVTPRVSASAYLRKPSATGGAGDTKVTFNAGTGIKAPAVYQELSSLASIVKDAVPGIPPIGPERSRGFDVGIEQALAGGRVRARASYFRNTFSDLIEYVSSSVLPQLGVTPDAAAASGYGAYVNSSSYRSQGIEVSTDASIGPVTFMASYTYLDAVVTKSLSDGVLTPAINPAFPNTPIGQYAPLVGARPFRRPQNSGNLMARYSHGKLQLLLAGYFSGKADDSTFLSDGDFGYSMLLPNHDLDAAFQKIDLSASYELQAHARWYVSIENLLNEHYEAASGYPALPFAIRTGVTIGVGGK